MNVKFYSHANKIHFRNEGFALSLVLKVTVFGSFRKWPICPSLIYYEQRCGHHNHLRAVVVKVLR